MGTTTNYKFPFPEPTDAPNVPLHLGNTAKAVDTSLKTVDSAVATLNGTVQGLDATVKNLDASVKALQAAQASPPRVRVYGNTSVPNNAASVKVSWTAADYKVGGTWWTSGEWLTIPVTGVYSILASVQFSIGVGTGGSSPAANTALAIELIANDVGQGEEYLSGHGEHYISFAIAQEVQTAYEGRLAAGRKIKLHLAQNSGSSRSAYSKLAISLVAKD